MNACSARVSSSSSRRCSRCAGTLTAVAAVHVSAQEVPPGVNWYTCHQASSAITIDGRLEEITPPPPTGAATCVVLASGGYPDSYQTRLPVSGVADAGADTLVFQAGTRREGDDLLTSGGRVLAVTGLGSTVAEATAQAYVGADHIDFENAVRREDIAAGEA